jgi:hypothetical protein
MSRSDYDNLCHALLRPAKLALALLGMALVPAAALRAQCTLVCNNSLQVSLDQNGQAIISIPLVSPSAPTSCPGGTLELRLFGPQGQPLPSNTLGCAQVGQTITAQLRHLQSGNNCSTAITVQDAMAPSLSCPDLFVFCNDDNHPATIGYPQSTDNCSPAQSTSMTHYDEAVNLPCGSMQAGQPVRGRIDRYWTVEDGSGNSNSCVQKIWIKRFSVQQVVLPPNLTGLSALACGQNPNDLDLTGQPTINENLIPNLGCDVAVIHSDQIANICPPAGYTVLRTWTAIDNCSNAIVQQQQIIRVEDRVKPSITLPPGITVGTAGFICGGSVTLPQPQLSDNCSAVTASVSWDFGNGYGPFHNVPEGSHVATYTATDACGNTRSATLSVTVVDVSPPQANCAAALQISLASNGQGFVTPNMLNQNSEDNCGPVFFAVSRDEVNFGPSAEFSCADAGQTIPVTLRVTDVSGLENFCESSVSVRDFLKPTLQCPANITLNCLQDAQNLSLTGQASATDNCGTPTLDFGDTPNLDACRTGSILRQWLATDAAGNTRSCSQQIAVQVVSTVAVSFPANLTVSACANADATLPPSTGQPGISGQHCTPISIVYNDQVFNNAPAPACYRIFRSWQVHDWCAYEASGGTAGFWQHLQTITVVDNQAPVLALPPDLTVQAAAGCQATVLLDDVLATDCGPVALSHDSPFATATGSNASGLYPLGNHVVTFFASDDCGNSGTATLRISVVDATPPTALCRSGLSLNLDADGKAALAAATVNNGSSDGCTPSAGLLLTLSRDSFDCALRGPQPLTLTVRDAAGNSASCNTVVQVLDPLNACRVGYLLEGLVRTEGGAAVADVPVRLQRNGLASLTHCDTEGWFAFDTVEAANYALAPENNANWLNGVTTFDLVLISKHILGIQPIESPYRMMAADANRSGSITTFDIVQLRKLILGIFDTLPGNSSWRFVPADYQFPDPFNPFAEAAPAALLLDSLAADRDDLDFVGFKVGDINGTADPSQPRGAAGDSLALHWPDRSLQPGERLELPVFPPILAHDDLEGFQFGLHFDPALLRPVGSAAPDGSPLRAEHLHWPQPHTLRLSWQRETAQPNPPSGLPLCTVLVEALKPCSLGEALRLEAPFAAEAYAASGLLHPIALRFSGDAAAAAAPQCSPNPFRERTLVPLPPGLSEGLFSVRDAQGKLVVSRHFSAPVGQNLLFEGRELPSAGVYFWQISSAAGRWSGKMIFAGE